MLRVPLIVSIHVVYEAASTRCQPGDCIRIQGARGGEEPTPRRSMGLQPNSSGSHDNAFFRVFHPATRKTPVFKTWHKNRLSQVDFFERQNRPVFEQQKRPALGFGRNPVARLPINFRAPSVLSLPFFFSIHSRMYMRVHKHMWVSLCRFIYAPVQTCCRHLTTADQATWAAAYFDCQADQAFHRHVHCLFAYPAEA